MTFVFMLAAVIGMLAPATAKAEEAAPTNDLVIDEVTGEVLSMRDEYTQAFMQEDGQIKVYSYTVPIFYRDANKELVEIDGTLVKSENEKYAYTSKANNVKTYLADNIADEKPVMMTYGNAAITVSPVNAASSKATVLTEDTEYKYDTGKGNLFADETALYRDTYKDADLAITTSNVGMRQNLILKSEDAKNTYMFEIGTKNVTAVSENGMVVFVNRMNEVVFKLCAPTAIDAEGNHSDGTVEIARETEDSVIVRMALDSEFLDNGAVYPVTTSMVYSTRSMNNPTLDVYTVPSNHFPTWQVWNGSYLVIDAAGVYKIYTSFSQPSNTNVSTADLCLTVESSTSNVSAYRIRTWGCLDSFTVYSLKYTEPTRTSISRFVIATGSDVYDTEVQDIINGSATVYGFCTRYSPLSSHTLPSGATAFYATEYGNQYLAPYLMYTIAS